MGPSGSVLPAGPFLAGILSGARVRYVTASLQLRAVGVGPGRLRVDVSVDGQAIGRQS